MKRQSHTGICGVITLFLGILLVVAPAWAVERYVPSQYPDIQTAINACVDGDEVVIEPNTYTGNGNRDLDYGGKAITVRSTDPNDPNVVAATIIDCEASEPDRHRGFYFHTAEDANSVVAGITIINGWEGSGGGICCEDSSPTIANCTIRDCGAFGGGGIRCWRLYIATAPIIVNCTITGNAADFDGGGIECYIGSAPIIINCTITTNTAVYSGGGIECYSGSSAAIINSTISGNRADAGDGGGIHCWYDVGAIVANSIISDNAAGENGGGTSCAFLSHPVLTNCTFSGNHAGMAGGALYCEMWSEATLTNCIVYGNTASDNGDEIALTDQTVPSTLTLSYCDVPSGPNDVHVDPNCTLNWGSGNIDADPLFADPNGADGDPNTWQDNDYHLSPNSPCADTGDPYGYYADRTDIDGQPRVMGKQVDMGSDELPLVVHNITQDIYYVTIQGAIDEAMNGDEIVLSPWTFTGDGNRDLDFGGKGITVRSTDPNDPNVVAATVIDSEGTGADQHTGFWFSSGEGPSAVVAGLTITGGYTSAGGGIICENSSPTITHCVVTGNYANQYGGGVYCDYGSATLTFCTITENSAAYGGGIYCMYPNATISNCTLTGNLAFYHGGGIRCMHSGGTIANTTICRNAAVGDGGGIACYDSDPAITNCTISGNTSDGIYCISGNTPAVTNCIVWDNSRAEISGTTTVSYSDVEGGISGEGNIDQDPLFVDPNGPDGDPDTWHDNDYHLSLNSPCINVGDPNGDYTDQADIDGQARVMGERVDMGSDEFPVMVHNVTQDTWYKTIQAAIDDANDADEIVLGPWTFTGEGNRDLADPTGVGITIRSTDPNDPDVVAATIIKCHDDDDPIDPNDPDYEAHRGFWLNNSSGANCVLAGLTITNAWASAGGAIVCVSGSSPTIVNCTITGNAAEEGAGIRCIGASPTIINCTITNNVIYDGSPGGRGGGILCAYDGTPTITNCTIADNFGIRGGGICCYECDPRITDCTISNNVADIDGGGILCEAFSSPTIANCTITGNSVEWRDSYYAPIIPFDGRGGGITCFAGAPTITNCTIAGNHADGGGGIHCYASNPTITHCTITGNLGMSGGGIQFVGELSPEQAVSATISNCILWHNSAVYGRQIELGGRFISYGTATVSYCNIQGGERELSLIPEIALNWGDGNIDLDPILTADAHLRAGSPCINAGDPGFVLDPNTPTDVDGDDRVLGGRIDMGADELLDTDSDGLPEWWEVSYYDPNTGPDPNTAAQASADPDNDGRTNLEEYRKYGSCPTTRPYYVDGTGGSDGLDGLASSWDGTHGPKRTIQAGIDVAVDGDTVIVLPGTYTGTGNRELDYAGKSVVIRSRDGLTATTIDLDGGERALDYDLLRGVPPALEGFTLTGSGSSINANAAGLMLKDCRLDGSGTGYEGGGQLSGGYAMLVIDNVAIDSDTHPDPNRPDAGWIQGSHVTLQGDLRLESGTLDLQFSSVDGPNTIYLEDGSLLNISQIYYFPQVYCPTVIRSNVNGPGDIEIDLGAELVIASDATVDLGTDANYANGQITVNGSLVAREAATIQNADIFVTEAAFEGNNAVQDNDITLLEASGGYGGQFFVEGSATVRRNTIVSEGDRYLDLDPDPDTPNRPTIADNDISVIIKQTPGTQGILLELRALDYDCGGPNNPNGESGAFQVPPSHLDFPNDPAENWVLEELRIDPNARLNLTNRQGFVFQEDANYPETIYIKELKLCDDAVLNTGLQALYYDRLVDGSGVEIVRDPNQPNGPFANGSRIVDIPMMGFSLVVIAMESDREFAVRVRTRITDVSDADPNHPEASLPEGSILRKEALVPADPNRGVMEMRTQADGEPQSASSVAAVGAFARAAEDEIAVIFDYLFRQNPSGDAYLTVYLCDRHDPDANAVPVARVYPPAFDRAGAIGSDEFAVFHATMPRGDFNFTRGTYVKIVLHGDDAVCWIDNWDPYISCEDQECANIDGVEGVSETDYLLLLVAATGQDLASMWCADVTGDGYLDITDLLSWDAFFATALNACPNEPPLAPRPGGSKGVSPFTLGNSVGGGNVIVIAGKSGDPGDYQYDVLYTLDPNGGFAEDKRFPNCPVVGQCDTGNGRLLLDDAGMLHQVHGVQGVVQRDTGTAIIEPNHSFTYNEDPNFGDSDVWVGIANEEGLPLTDAVFDRRDSTYVYVVPVLVQRPGGAGDPYKAVAKLEILGDPNDGNYDLVGLYGKDPNAEPNQSIDPLNGNVTLETDVWQVREVDVDGYGNVFALSAQAWNENDWVLIYNEALGNGSEVRVLLKDVLGAELAAPTALHVSCDDTTLWLASAKNAPDASSTQVYRFTIDRSGTTATGLTSAGSVEITNMRHVTSMTEDPATGTVYVMGVMAPTFDPEAGNPDADTPIFTWPTLAVIPDGVGGPVAATEISSEDPNHDLALPLSAVFVPAGTCYTLTVIFDGSDGTVTADPDLGCYAPNAPVLLTAEPLGNKKFTKWKVWDGYDANVTAIDTNNPITIDMVADRQVKAFFKCGGGGMEEALPLLTAGLILSLTMSRHLRRRG